MTCRSAFAACWRTPESEALALATRLDQLNVERREIEARMQGVALAAVKQSARTRTRMAHAPRRVPVRRRTGTRASSGLVASRIKDRVRRPVIAFARNADGTLRGSARSVPGIHIRDVLDGIAARHPELISRFGGHADGRGPVARRAAPRCIRARIR